MTPITIAFAGLILLPGSAVAASCECSQGSSVVDSCFYVSANSGQSCDPELCFRLYINETSCVFGGSTSYCLITPDPFLPLAIKEVRDIPNSPSAACQGMTINEFPYYTMNWGNHPNPPGCHNCLGASQTLLLACYALVDFDCNGGIHDTQEIGESGSCIDGSCNPPGPPPGP